MVILYLSSEIGDIFALGAGSVGTVDIARLQRTTLGTETVLLGERRRKSHLN